jgi:hypothetical protein
MFENQFQIFVVPMKINIWKSWQVTKNFAIEFCFSSPYEKFEPNKWRTWLWFDWWFRISRKRDHDPTIGFLIDIADWHFEIDFYNINHLTEEEYGRLESNSRTDQTNPAS